MQRANRIIYFLINFLWAFSIVISSLLIVDEIETTTHLLNTIASISVGIFQIYGGYKLFKGDLIIPILATCFFLFNIDLVGFKFVSETLAYIIVGVENAELLFNGQLLNDPTLSTNLSFSQVSFKSISFNFLASFQIGLLLFEYEKENGLATYFNSNV